MDCETIGANAPLPLGQGEGEKEGSESATWLCLQTSACKNIEQEADRNVYFNIVSRLHACTDKMRLSVRSRHNSLQCYCICCGFFGQYNLVRPEWKDGDEMPPFRSSSYWKVPCVTGLRAAHFHCRFCCGQCARPDMKRGNAGESVWASLVYNQVERQVYCLKPAHLMAEANLKIARKLHKSVSLARLKEQWAVSAGAAGCVEALI